MGLIKEVLLLPFAPVRGSAWGAPYWPGAGAYTCTGWVAGATRAGGGYPGAG